MHRTPPLIVRLLGDLLCEDPLPGEEPLATAARWLSRSELGSQLTDYLRNEASLIAMAANRLNLCDDTDVREMALELGLAADRLWNLTGTPPAQRV